MALYKSKKDPEVYYYFNKNNEKLWMFRHKYHDSLGKRKEKKKSGFKTEKAALRALLEVKTATLNGQSKQMENDQLTVAKWLDIWFETYNNSWEVTSRLQRKNAIKYQMKPLLGQYKLKDLDKTTYVRVYINELLKKYKPNTVTLFHRLFKIAINAAVEDEIIPRNRFNKITIDQDEELKNFLTPEELNVFLNAAKQYDNITNYTFVLILAYTGLRKGEALGLKWENIDLNEKTVTVDCTRDRYGDRNPKTKNSYRTIPIDDILVDQLKVYQKWCVETKFSYGMKLNKKKDYVLISHQGGSPIGSTTAHYLFERLYTQMKKHEIEIKRITPHGLRHTHATMLINAGVPPKTIAERLGNTVEMIYNVYSHSFKELEDKAVDAFRESLLGGAKSGAN
ncbi:site-specific integrase [Lentibacillus saliphilus]|uniref:site-specific integrase n=1 Tax=Lentibacillus saliphilus TaxID=2737028 RepID=UPI001C2FD151|nr:site-specific integrase [Lentibacillus saliphilus]